jgi:predicted enzyme related to lactoylglutathione lyase
MANPHGSFVWYELLTTDAAAASGFYGDVIGWAARDAGVPGVDYRLFSNKGQDVAGHMTIPQGAPAQMRPGWLGYVGVDDVDAAVRSCSNARSPGANGRSATSSASPIAPPRRRSSTRARSSRWTAIQRLKRTSSGCSRGPRLPG